MVMLVILVSIVVVVIMVVVVSMVIVVMMVILVSMVSSGDEGNGVELAYALLTSLFFRHNEHISSSREHRSEALISAYCEYSTEGELESFGLSSVCRNERPEPEVHVPISKVKMVKLEYQKVQQLLNSLEIDSSIEEVTQDNTNLEFTSEEALSILK